jgi:hypothetical protein
VRWHGSVADCTLPERGAMREELVTLAQERWRRKQTGHREFRPADLRVHGPRGRYRAEREVV